MDVRSARNRLDDIDLILDAFNEGKFEIHCVDPDYKELDPRITEGKIYDYLREYQEVLETRPVGGLPEYDLS